MKIRLNEHQIKTLYFFEYTRILSEITKLNLIIQIKFSSVKFLNIHQHLRRNSTRSPLHLSFFIATIAFISRKHVFRFNYICVSLFEPVSTVFTAYRKKLNKFRRKRKKKKRTRKKNGLTKGMEATWFAPVSLHKDFSRLSISRRRVEKNRNYIRGQWENR